MAGYLGNIPVPQATQTRQSFTATASQTSFPTIGYTEGFFDCHLNGVKLLAGVDFNVGGGNGSDVILATGAALNDILEVTIFDTFNTSSGTFSSTTLKNNVTLKNDTHEDSDGGRASKIIYQGEQSGGEITTLAEIEASHDGTADDQKGDLIFRTNDGSDGTSPTEVLRTNSAGNLLITSSDQNGLTLNTTDSNGGFIALKTSGTAKGYIGTSHHLVSGGSPSEDDITIRAEGKLQFAIGATEELRLDSDGLKFNGDTAAGNALSDYEHGSGNASITGSGGGTITTSGDKTYYYTKIGNLVHFQVEFSLTGIGGCSGATQIALPFQSIDYVAGSVRAYAATYTGNSLFCEAHPSGTQVLIKSQSSGNPSHDVLSSTTSYYFVTLTYIAT
tara:strand:- start:126 stop:1292 length:1167 start_codon:yes stop_codon:yes gene_type:complete